MDRMHAHSPFAEDSRPRPVGPPPAVPVLAHHLVLGSAAATAVLLGAAGVIVTLEEDQLMGWWGSPAVSNGTLDLVDLLGSLTALTNLVALIATGVWLLRIRAVAEWAAPGDRQRRSSAWAVLGWIVPVVNLWFPYQVVADASRALGSSVRTFWPWWIAWLALNFSVLDRSGGELASAQELTTWIRSQQLEALVAVVACILWWRVVRSTTRAAQAVVAGSRVVP
ncbi:DUF4328 domain-containing protein [Janibacter sp. GS2]|uniref:DUF4328 domain-containing protein n=1 Tax=Janibacter sp. GS2 TaxID=3442646 RepID=UPI003EB775BB